MLVSATNEFTTKVYKIACLSGDGIGPEVTREAVKVLRKIEELGQRQRLAPAHTSADSRRSVRFQLRDGLIGGAAYDVHGFHLPPATLELVADSDAVLLGSVGGTVEQQTPDNPKWHNAERNALLGIREHLQLGVNIRPAVVFPCLRDISPLKNERLARGVDLIIVRELLGCVYFGEHIDNGDEATDTMRYHKDQIARTMEFAFQIAKLQPSAERRKVTVVDKANVLQCSRLWRRVATEVHTKQFQDVQLEFMYVDAAVLQLLLAPWMFSVVATGNLFGDILSDLASGLPGSLGLMPSVSFGPRVHLYEPAGGSAPNLTGKNVANPIAQILSVSMMLRYSFGMDREAAAIQQAVQQVLAAGARTADLTREGEDYISTSEMGDAVMAKLEEIYSTSSQSTPQ